MLTIPDRPVRQALTLRERFDRLLDELESWPFELWENLPVPVDMQETDDEVIVTATMPGIRMEDIEINLQGSTLTIRGESREEREETTGTWHRRERKIGSVERRVLVPVAVDADRAEASLRDGVLRVRLPKQNPEPVRKIEVKED